MEINNLNIFEKMQKITDEIGTIIKNLEVKVSKTSSYKAVSEKDILDNVKPLESKYRVYSYPIKREVIDRDTLVKESEYNGAIIRTNTLFMRVETIYRFVNLDNVDEFIETTVYGDGLDTGDKAPGKAMTYADKYALMKAYKISTGDDPDKEASPEQGYTKISKKEIKATDMQIKKIKNILNEDQIKKACDLVKKEKLEDFTIQEASNLIQNITKENK